MKAKGYLRTQGLWEVVVNPKSETGLDEGKYSKKADLAYVFFILSLTGKPIHLIEHVEESNPFEVGKHLSITLKKIHRQAGGNCGRNYTL